MRISEAFPSKYMKATDLAGREWNLSMSHVSMEEIGGDQKPVLYFAGAEKGLVLNKINTEMIITMYGDETDTWQGQPLSIKPDKTQFNARIVDCIRVVWKARQQNGTGAPRHPAAPLPAQPFQNAAPTPAAAPGGSAMPAGDPLNDDIPFAVPFDISRKRGFRV